MNNKLKKGLGIVKNSKDALVLLSNFGYLSILQVASYIFPILTLPYLTKVIGVDSFGKIAFASAIMIWFKTIVDWGFSYTATRDIAKNRNDNDKISEIFSNVFWAKCLLMTCSFFLLLLLTSIVPKFKENQDIILMTFLIIPGQIMFPDWFFQGMERMKYITIFNIISKLSFTIAVFVFIKEKSDYLLQPLFIALGFFFSGLFAMYFILFKMKVKLKMTSFPDLILTIKASTDVFLNNLLPNFYNSFSVLLLGFWGGSIGVGLFDAGKKFTTIAYNFMNVISRVFFPYLSRRIDKHDTFVKLYLSISAIGSLLLFFLAPILIKLFFSPEFFDAIIILQITSVSLFLLALTDVYGQNYLIIQDYEKELRNITFKSSIVGFLLSLPLVYYFDYIGAAMVLVITRAILGISIMFKAREIKRLKNTEK